MVIVLIHNPENGQMHMHIENGPAEMALGVLKNAEVMLAKQLRAPKLHLPNGQAHAVIDQEETPQPPQEGTPQ